jgi:hypothetical protein
MNDFQSQVKREARGMGWSPDLAAKLARLVGRPVGERKQAPRGPVGKAPRVVNHPREIASLLRVCGLPASMQADFSAAGVLTFEGVRKMLGPVFPIGRPPARCASARPHPPIETPQAMTYNRSKYRRLIEDHEGRLVAARAESELFLNAREDQQRTNAEWVGHVTLHGVPLTLDEMLAIPAEELKPFGLRRDTLLSAVDAADRVAVYQRRAAEAQARVAESAPVVESLRRYVEQLGATI